MRHLSFAILLVLFGVGVYFVGDFWLSRPVSKQEFVRAHKFLNRRIDTLQDNQHKMIANQRTLYRSQQALRDSLISLGRQMRQMQSTLDSLQSQVRMLRYGQTVIYDALTSPEPSHRSQNRFRQLIEWFSGE